MKTLFIAASLLLSVSAFAQPGNKAEKIGRMPVSASQQLNENGGRMVRTITVTPAPLSAEEQQLLTLVALGGLRQLRLSEALLPRITDAQVRLLAQSEVDEQTTVAAKLQEIARAKGLTLPTTPDEAAQTLLGRIPGLSDAQVNGFYLTESGIRGHELLQQTMESVSSKAKDPALRRLATATLPIIRIHLQVAREVQAGMGAAK